jgi:hypothetical protein
MATKADLQRFAPAPKAPAPRRSEPYRRWVATLRCSHCNVQGFSQCAHPNKGGKAKGRKMDDGLSFPLCCERPGIVGCHSRHDQYKLLPAAEIEHYERAWALQTQKLARVQGRWPRNWTQP